MDSPRDTDRPIVEDGRADDTARDLRDVLRGLVVSDGGREDVSLREIASAAGGSERLIPELLAALEHDATAVRIGAAWALCALADEQPKATGYLTERIAERVDDGDEPFEVGQVLSYLRGRYPGRVADTLDAAAAEGALEGDRPPADARWTGPARADGGTPDDRVRTDGGTAAADPASDSGPRGKRIETDGGVPASTVADLGDGRQVVRPSGDGPEVHQRPARPPEPAHPGETPTGPGHAPPEDHPTHPDFDGETPDAGTGETRPVGRTETGGRTRPDTATEPETDHTGPSIPDDRPETPETFASVAALSRYDQLSAVAEGTEKRYATGYRCRAVADDEVSGVAVRLFDRPEEGDRLAFREALDERLARWQALADGDHVVDVAEWGQQPRPWVATQPIDASLAERDRPPIDEALRQAVALAEALAHCHRHGAVHAGLDPRNVVFPGDGLEGLDRPILDNVGLMHAFRSHFEPSSYLDPRFAAPEYYDSDFGSVDTATDVYGLGAVCYSLFTGRPPFDGSYEEVRRAVLEESPVPPSAVIDAVPEAIDEVIAKALAKRKLTRYESVAAVLADLKRVADRDG